MDLKVSFDSQEMLLKEDRSLPVSICKTCKHKAKLEYIAYVVFVTVSVVTCAVACICAIYCYQILQEIEILRKCDINKDYMRSPTVSAQLEKAFSSSTSPMSGTEYIVEDFSAADQDDFEVEKIDQKDSDDGSSRVQENERSAASRNNDRISETYLERFNVNAEKPLRLKRRAGDGVKNCKRKCKSLTKKDKRDCRKKCGGGEPNKIKKSNFIYQINLPAAHFEANMFDETAQRLVNTKYNRIKSQDEGPLRIFKQAQWVNGPSPFTFIDNSVAKATSSGIFFVYAQAYIGGNEPEKSIIIIQKRYGEEINALSCDNGVNQGSGNRSQMQTCAVSGLMKLEKDDTVEIQRSDVTIKISLDKDKTFFGLVQLSGITATNQ